MANRQKKQVPMLKRLRNKFIFTNMLFVVIVLLVVFFTVSAVNYNQRVNDIYSALTHSISMSGATTPDVAGVPANGDSSSGSGAAAPSDAAQAPADSSGYGAAASGKSGGKRESSSDQFVATSSYVVDSDGNVTTTIDNPLNLDSDTVASAVQTILDAQSASGSQNVRGHISSLNLYYSASVTDSGIKLALASGNYVDSNMLSLIATLAVVSLAALAAFLLMSFFLSRWALRPVSRAWKQQQQFVADASHELKTPLTVIIANDSILMSQPDATVESQMQWIESTETEAHLMQGLVNDMLYLAQPEDVDRVVTCGQVDFSDLVESTVLQFESVAFERGIQMDSSVSPDLHVEGDAARLQRLISTLVDNACKYVNEKGTVSIDLRRAGSDCRMVVSNTGPVIDPEDLPHLFDRFYRSDKARTRGKGGFGLGLSIAKSVVEDHGGTIEARSTKEAGTSFTVTLPIQD